MNQAPIIFCWPLMRVLWHVYGGPPSMWNKRWAGTRRTIQYETHKIALADKPISRKQT